ncbi:MAG: hypothetical protein PHF56_25395 [Desulfuromonadaceae bacterium]|nr:hypothetical protein [Desulfuromonadaceae bacterium]
MSCTQGETAGCGAAFGGDVKLIATLSGSSTFGGWSGDCTGMEPECTVTMSTSRDVTATFNPAVTATAEIGTTGYATVKDAYDAATTGALIKLLAGAGALNASSNKSVRLTGAMTGPLEIRSGKITAEELTVK